MNSKMNSIFSQTSSLITLVLIVILNCITHGIVVGCHRKGKFVILATLIAMFATLIGLAPKMSTIMVDLLFFQLFFLNLYQQLQNPSAKSAINCISILNYSEFYIGITHLLLIISLQSITFIMRLISIFILLTLHFGFIIFNVDSECYFSEIIHTWVYRLFIKKRF